VRLTGLIIALCIGLAALKAAATVIGLLIVAGLVVAAIQKPARAFGFIAGCTLLSLFGTHPWAGAVILASLAIMSRLQ
jgi:hypothetical protein